MTTNTAISYSVATNTAIRSLKAAITTCSTPEDIARLLETMEDNAQLLTVLMRDWIQLRQEEAELARQAERAKAATTEPDTTSIF
jgi:hypothetical protein